MSANLGWALVIVTFCIYVGYVLSNEIHKKIIKSIKEKIKKLEANEDKLNE